MRKLRLNRHLLVATILLATHYSVSAQTPIRKVLLEEFTTASCGNCPMMSAYINSWQLAHANSTILISIHEGSGVDAMSNSTTNTIFSAMHPAGGWFAPAIMIDRGVYPWVDPEPYLNCYKSWGSAPTPGNDTIASRLMSEPAKVSVGISGTYNSSTRTINATVNTKFFAPVPSGDWRISLFLVEDSVIGYPNLGAFAGWDQHCYDPTWANTNYPGKFDGTSIIGYPHRHVMRKSLLGDWGKQGIIPSVPVNGTVYSTTATLVVDTAYKENHLTLVAFVSSYGSTKSLKYVLNANDTKVTSSFATGINEPGYPDKAIASSAIENIYPVPSNGLTMIVYTLTSPERSSITINNIYGQRIDVLAPSLNVTGRNEVSFDASTFAKGIYFISLNTPTGSSVKKFIVE